MRMPFYTSLHYPCTRAEGSVDPRVDERQSLDRILSGHRPKAWRPRHQQEEPRRLLGFDIEIDRHRRRHAKYVGMDVPTVFKRLDENFPTVRGVGLTHACTHAHADTYTHA